MEAETISKWDCERYEQVRISGITNMFMITKVCSLSGLSKEQVLFIMEHYNELNEKFNFRIEVKE